MTPEIEENEAVQEEAVFISIDHDMWIVMQNEVETIVGGRILRQPQRLLKFEGPNYRTHDPDEIKFIRDHATFNRRIFEGVLPNDMVQVRANVQTFVCSFPNCDEITATLEQMQEHKKLKHVRRTAAPVGGVIRRLVGTSSKPAVRKVSSTGGPT